jgi:hypothetical protein
MLFPGVNPCLCLCCESKLQYKSYEIVDHHSKMATKAVYAELEPLRHQVSRFLSLEVFLAGKDQWSSWSFAQCHVFDQLG